MAANFTPESFAAEFGVSRETLARIETFVTLLKRWNRRINLVASGSLAQVWARHVADSAQLFDLSPDQSASWIDLGSGAGLPALIVAAIAAEKRPGLCIRMVESDIRKAAFLREAAREMRLTVAIEARRIEELSGGSHDVVSARALAPLAQLCSLAERFRGPGTVFLFPKGVRLESELTEASRDWHIRAERIASRTDPEATVLRIWELKPRS